jgi:hypothetical protein
MTNNYTMKKWIFTVVFSPHGVVPVWWVRAVQAEGRMMAIIASDG